MIMEAKTTKKINLNHFETSSELSEIKAVYKCKQRSKIKISSSKDSYDFLSQIFDQDSIEFQEQFYMLLLNRTCMILGWVKISMGGTAGTVVDPKIVFSLALQTNAHSIILSHNHPSGNIKPSENDISLTKRLSASASLLEIRLLDHIIVSPFGEYYSFADEGILD